MTDRFVTVPDSLELPPAVKVPVARLIGPTGAAATPADLGAATAAQGSLADATTVEQVTLTANLAYTLPAGIPANTVHCVTFTQDGTGGHTVTYGGSPVTVGTTAGASTLVELWPNGTAARAVVYPAAEPEAAWWAALERAALGLDGGAPSTIYTIAQSLDGGAPSTIYTITQSIDGGEA